MTTIATARFTWLDFVIFSRVSHTTTITTARFDRLTLMDALSCHLATVVWILPYTELPTANTRLRFQLILQHWFQPADRTTPQTLPPSGRTRQYPEASCRKQPSLGLLNEQLKKPDHVL